MFCLSYIFISTRKYIRIVLKIRQSLPALFHRVILSGLPALSPVARVRDPVSVTRQVLEQTGCINEDLQDQCLRAKPVQDIISVQVRHRFFTAQNLYFYIILYGIRLTIMIW